MKTWEKICSIMAFVIAVGLLVMLMLFPELRQLNRLLFICLLGIMVNVGLMFLVLRDIFTRQFSNPNMRLIWIAVVLVVWPSVIYYLLRHGFRPRN